MPLPDGDEGIGGQMATSRAASVGNRSAAVASAIGTAVGKRASTSLLRQSLVPGQTIVAPVSTRLGSAPPGSRARLSPPGFVHIGDGPRHQSAPHPGTVIHSTGNFCTAVS